MLTIQLNQLGIENAGQRAVKVNKQLNKKKGKQNESDTRKMLSMQRSTC